MIVLQAFIPSWIDVELPLFQQRVEWRGASPRGVGDCARRVGAVRGRRAYVRPARARDQGASASVYRT